MSLCKQPTLTVSANYGRNLDLRLLRGRAKLPFQFLCHPISCLSLFLFVFRSSRKAWKQVNWKLLPRCPSRSPSHRHTGRGSLLHSLSSPCSHSGSVSTCDSWTPPPMKMSINWICKPLASDSLHITLLWGALESR